MDTRKNKIRFISKCLAILLFCIGLLVIYFKYYFPSGNYVATNSCIFESFDFKWSQDSMGVIISNQQSEHFNIEAHDRGPYYVKFPIVTKGFKKYIAITNKKNEIEHIQIHKHWGSIITIDYQTFSKAVLDTVYSDRELLKIIPFSDNMIYPSMIYKEGEDCDLEKVDIDDYIRRMNKN